MDPEDLYVDSDTPEVSEAVGQFNPLAYMFLHLMFHHFIIATTNTMMTTTDHPVPDLLQRANSEMHCLNALRKALNNPNATWVSAEQKDAVIAVMERKTDVLAMLKTGGGKSMLAIIPAIVSKNTGIVIVLPLKSLIIDWRRKLDDMEVSYQEYDGRPLNSSINLILVSADRASFGGWRTLIAELNQRLPITRMVFDEAHLPLISDDFRSSLARVNELREHSMQLILLSGTVPPESVPSLKKSFGLLADSLEIRQRSNRPELEYILEQGLPSGSIPERIKEIVFKEQNGWLSKDRGLIFVAYINDGEALAQSVCIC